MLAGLQYNQTNTDEIINVKNRVFWKLLGVYKKSIPKLPENKIHINVLSFNSRLRYKYFNINYCSEIAYCVKGKNL